MNVTVIYLFCFVQLQTNEYEGFQANYRDFHI